MQIIILAWVGSLLDLNNQFLTIFEKRVQP